MHHVRKWVGLVCAVRSKGPSPPVCAPLMPVSSKVPAAVPLVTHRLRSPAGVGRDCEHGVGRCARSRG
jgi:hypothetical protein